MAMLVILILTATLFADAREDFNQAVELYNQGEFQEALELFKSVEEQGYVDAELFYNLGNCYYKTEHKGMAVAYYLKALKQDPRDDDIKSNLLFVRSTLRDKYEDTVQNPIWGFVKSSALSFHVNELTIISFVFFLGLIVILIFQVFYKQKNPLILAGIIALIVLLVISGSLLGINLKLNYFTDRAVIIEPEVNVLAGPGATSDIRFTAHEGLTFEILKQESGYYEAIFANNLKGWIDIAKAYQYE